MSRGFKITLLLIMFSLIYASSIAGQKNIHQARKKQPSSLLKGFYGTYPVLTDTKVARLTNRLASIKDKLFLLKAKRDSLKYLLPDSMIVKRYISFLGDFFTYPHVSDRQKSWKRLKRAINKLESEQISIKQILIKNEKYLEKKFLWGLASWEIRKKSKPETGN